MTRLYANNDINLRFSLFGVILLSLSKHCIIQVHSFPEVTVVLFANASKMTYIPKKFSTMSGSIGLRMSVIKKSKFVFCQNHFFGAIFPKL